MELTQLSPSQFELSFGGIVDKDSGVDFIDVEIFSFSGSINQGAHACDGSHAVSSLHVKYTALNLEGSEDKQEVHYDTHASASHAHLLPPFDAPTLTHFSPLTHLTQPTLSSPLPRWPGCAHQPGRCGIVAAYLGALGRCMCQRLQL